MNVRIAHLLSLAALALPLANGASAADSVIRTNDAVAVSAQGGNGSGQYAQSAAAKVVYSREVLEYPGKLGNGDIQPSQVAYTKVVRSSPEFGFGQDGKPGVTAASKQAPVAARKGSTEGTLGN